MFSPCLGRRPPAALVSIASAIVATCLCAGSAHGDGLADMAGTWRFRTRVGDTVFSDCPYNSRSAVREPAAAALPRVAG